jgi:hypothetical protein
MMATIVAVALGFGCAVGIATLWLRGLLGAMARKTYNVSNVPERTAAGL